MGIEAVPFVISSSIMPIKVQCECGKAFSAKDELAGKTVKCPGCQKPLKITGGASPAKASAAKPSSAPAPKGPAAKAAPAVPAGQMDDMFDDIGLKAPEAGTVPCPGCGEPMAIAAVEAWPQDEHREGWHGIGSA